LKNRINASHSRHCEPFDFAQGVAIQNSRHCELNNVQRGNPEFPSLRALRLRSGRDNPENDTLELDCFVGMNL